MPTGNKVQNTNNAEKRKKIVSGIFKITFYLYICMHFFPNYKNINFIG